MNGDFGWLELPGGSDCHGTGVFYARSLGWQVEDDGQTVWFRALGSGYRAVFQDPAGTTMGLFEPGP